MNSARILVGLLVLLPGLAGARGAVPPQPVLPETGRTVAVENFDHRLLAREIFRETNRVRTSQGRSPFKPEPRLAAAADGQAALQAIRIHNSHESPLASQADPLARVRLTGLPPGTVGENAMSLNARNRETGENYSYRDLAVVIVQAWMDSPGHRANLLDPKLHFLGCGARIAYLLPGQAMVYAIQDFYTPAVPSATPP